MGSRPPPLLHSISLTSNSVLRTDHLFFTYPGPVKDIPRGTKPQHSPTRRYVKVLFRFFTRRSIITLGI